MARCEALVTGFEPFGGDALNPSQQVVRRLAGWRADVQALVLPVVFGEASRQLDAAIDRLQPRVVIALGLAMTRPDIAVERVAVNLDDAERPDNAGQCPVDRPVVDGAPTAYLASLPVKAIVAAMREAGLRATVSMSAGAFVCNHVFYALAHRIAGGRGPRRGGFIHLPCLPQQGAPGRTPMALESMVAAVKIAVELSLAEPD